MIYPPLNEKQQEVAARVKEARAEIEEGAMMMRHGMKKLRAAFITGRCRQMSLAQLAALDGAITRARVKQIIDQG